MSLLLRQFQEDERGSVIILAAGLAPVLMGAVALGAEVGYWYLSDLKLQHTADVAAHAAGVGKRAGGNQERLEAAANEIVEKTGVSPGALEVFYPPQNGSFAGQPGFVEVALRDSLPRLLSSLFLDKDIDLSARAVAQILGGSQACILALSATAPAAIKVGGSATLNLSNCDIASNSMAADAFRLDGVSSSVTTDCLFTVGGAVTGTRLRLTDCAEVHENAPPVLDPYAGVPVPTTSGCASKMIGHPERSTTVTPTARTADGIPIMRFCGGLMIMGDVHFSPGIYIIDGGTLAANAGAKVTGTDVTFVLTNGASAKLNGDASLNLSAPTTGPYAGLLFFGGRDQTSVRHQINGGASASLQGAIYAPASHVEFSGNSALSGGCTQVIANTIEFVGGSSLGSECEAAGTKTVWANQMVKVVE